MSPRVVATPYGRSAVANLRVRLAELKRHDAMAPVTVLVPNHIAGVVARRQLAAGLTDEHPGVAGLFITTIDRLAERLAAHLLSPRRPAVRPIVASAWRTALAEDSGMFAAIRDHPATVAALLRTHRELRTLDPVDLSHVAASSPLAGDVARLHRAVVARLAPRFYDETDLLARATQRIADEPWTAAEIGAVVLYLPQDLTAPQRLLVDRLGKATSLTIIAGMTGDEQADRAAVDGIDGIDVIDGVGQTTRAPIQLPTAGTVLHASDSDDEVRCVVRRLLQDLQTIPAHRIAVLYAASSTYARIVHDHLEAAGIRFNGSGSRPTTERSIAQGTLRLVQAAVNDFPRAELFTALSAARTLTAAGGPVPVSTWERISRLAGVVSGEDWDLRLAEYAQRERRSAVEQRAKDDPIEAAAKRSDYNAETAEALRAFVLMLRRLRSGAAKISSWSELSRGAVEAFHTVYGDPDELLGIRIGEERNAARDIKLTLRGLSSLEEFEPGTASLARLLEILTVEIEAGLPRVGRFGEGVLVGSLSSAIGLDLDKVYVLGLAEDLYPGRVQPDPLIPDKIRRDPAVALRTERDRVAQLHRHLLAAFQATPDVVACFPRGNLRRSQPRLPSRWLMPTLRILGGDPTLVASRWDRAAGDKIIGSHSYSTELDSTTFPMSDQEWRVRAHRSSTAAPDPVVDAASTMITARDSARFTRFDGNLSGESGLPDFGSGLTLVSPTQLEGYASCPHSYLVERLLRVRPIEQPEEIITISPLEIGDLMHAAMDSMITHAKKHDQLPSYGQPWTSEQRSLLIDMAADLAEDKEKRGLTGHWRLWKAERGRILRDLDQMLIADGAWRADLDAEVLGSELPFGLKGQEPVVLELSRGRIALKGYADKIDRTRSGVVLVTDIKTGGSSAFKILTKDPVAAGTKLQLPVYAYAARKAFGATEATAQYWFVGKNPDSIPLTLDDDLDRTYRATLETLVTSIASGLFPAKPPTDDYGRQCSYCNPDNVSNSVQRDRWRVKRTDESLRDLVGLIQPEALETSSE